MGEPRYHAELAWLGGEVAADVLIEVRGDRFGAVTRGVPRPADAVRLPGLTVPGLANAHSHAFHRALRGRAQGGGADSFWTWRDRMYDLAARLDPDRYLELARAVYAEMALAGITCVGEFHYLHHGPDGARYDDPNVMGEVLLQAAGDAGIRITLLDTCYLAAGIGRPPSGVQLRFSDGDPQAWAERVDSLAGGASASFASSAALGGDRGFGGEGGGGRARLGAAIHSVRAVPPEAVRLVAEWAADRRAPLHVHLSEQPAENEECRQAHGLSPARLLAECGALGGRTVAVHATHLDEADVRLLGATTTGVCMCPTTERDLADGIGPARDLAVAGSPLCLGSDQHAVIDLFEEARAVELDERLRTRRRGHWSAGELLAMATHQGHHALGWPEAGRIEPGALADLVTVSLDSVRTAGAGPDQVAEVAVFTAGAADVRSVIVSGREVVRDGHHVLVGDVPAALRSSITELWHGLS